MPHCTVFHPARVATAAWQNWSASVAPGDRAEEKIRSLSGGQARRVEIARALVHRPALLLLDEPTIGLDVGSRQDIQDHVRKLMQEDGLGVLWATHWTNTRH